MNPLSELLRQFESVSVKVVYHFKGYFNTVWKPEVNRWSESQRFSFEVVEYGSGFAVLRTERIVGQSIVWGSLRARQSGPEPMSNGSKKQRWDRSGIEPAHPMKYIQNEKNLSYHRDSMDQVSRTKPWDRVCPKCKISCITWWPLRNGATHLTRPVWQIPLIDVVASDTW
jgi:hypothetical protein